MNSNGERSHRSKKTSLVQRTGVFNNALKNVKSQGSTGRKHSEQFQQIEEVDMGYTPTQYKNFKISIQNEFANNCPESTQRKVFDDYEENHEVKKDDQNSKENASSNIDLKSFVDKNVDISSEKWPIKQLLAISKLLEQTEKKKSGYYDCADKICNALNMVLKQIRGCRCRLYGSYNSGYAVETSDVNLELFSHNDGISSRFLLEVSKIIDKARPDFCVTYESALKLVDNYISCIEPQKGLICKIQHLGPTNTYFRTSELIKRLIDLDSRVKTLIIAMRHWAELCNIHEAGDEKLNPVCYVLMTVHFLQQISPPVLPVVDVQIDKDGTVFSNPRFNVFCTNNEFSVGELWIQLLEFYSSYNWRQHVINITNKNMILKLDTGHIKSWIAIQAPLEPKVNLAKSIVSPDVSQFIQNCFVESYKYFSTPLSQSSNDDDLENFDNEYNYCFREANFTKGSTLPESCTMCEELGYICDDCLDDEDDDSSLDTLPEMSEAFKDQLDFALKSVYDEHILNVEDIQKRKDVVKEIEVYIQEKFPNAKLDLMGSSINGFGLKKSDMDISLIFKGCKSEDLDDVEKLKSLRQHLRKSPDFSCVLGIFGAKVPLIQFVHKESQLRGDISMYNLLAFRNTELLKKYSEVDDRCKILGCALKLLAKNAGLANAAEKSLSSYSYVLLVIYYLQRTNPPVLPALQELPRTSRDEERKVEDKDTWFYRDISRLKHVWKEYHGKNNQSVGELWMGLLKFYTELMDFNQVISIRSSKTEYIDEVPLKNARLFNIQDPFLESKNLGSLMSELMSSRTSKTFLRARKLLSMPPTQVPKGYSDFKEYLFDPMNLTDGRIVKIIECSLCGKFGHSPDQCGRNNFNNVRRGRGRGRSTFLNPSRNMTDYKNPNRSHAP